MSFCHFGHWTMGKQTRMIIISKIENKEVIKLSFGNEKGK